MSYKTDLEYWDCFGRENLCLIIEEIWYSFPSVILDGGVDLVEFLPVALLRDEEM